MSGISGGSGSEFLNLFEFLIGFSCILFLKEVGRRQHTGLGFPVLACGRCSFRRHNVFLLDDFVFEAVAMVSVGAGRSGDSTVLCRFMEVFWLFEDSRANDVWLKWMVDDDQFSGQG